MATALRDNQDQIKTGGAIVSDYVHPHSVNSGLPTEEIEPPKVGNELEVDEAVLEGRSTYPGSSLTPHVSAESPVMQHSQYPTPDSRKLTTMAHLCGARLPNL